MWDTRIGLKRTSLLEFPILLYIYFRGRDFLWVRRTIEGILNSDDQNQAFFWKWRWVVPIFHPRQVSCQRFPASGLFGPTIMTYFRPILADFWKIFQLGGLFLRFGLSRAAQTPAARVGTRDRPIKICSPRAKFWTGPWPDPSLAERCWLVKSGEGSNSIFDKIGRSSSLLVLFKDWITDPYVA